MDNLTKNAIEDITNAMNVSEKEYEIPQLMDAADMAECPDELAVMTYVSYFRDWWLEDQKKRAAEIEAERQRKLRTADPSQCYAHGPGVERAATNNEAPFTIQAVNYFGDPLPTGGDDFVIEITGPASPQCNRVDNNNGTHSCSYVPTTAGQYQVAISLRGSPIKNSPYKPVIIGPDASHSSAYGPGVEGARVNQPAPFFIQSRDSTGKNVNTGGDPFTVNVSGPDGSPVQVSFNDKRDGTYEGVYTPTKPGHYRVDVALNGQPIKGSPYSPLMEAGNAGRSWAEGDGLTGGKTDHPLHIKIHSVDADGHPITHGGDPFQVAITGPENSNPAVRDNNDGTYDVEYSVGTPGDYTVNITLHGQPIKDSPFHPHVKPAADAGKSYAEGPGLHEAFDNEPAHFTIFAVDKTGKRRTDGGDPFDVRISGPEEIVPQVVDNGDGTYSVTYEPNVPGPYTINVELEGRPIKDAPFHVDCKSGTDVGLSGFAYFTFTVQSRDKHGQNKTFGGDVFDVSITGPADVQVEAVDNGDGTYSASYTLQQKGSYTINVTLNGKKLGGTPLTQSF